MLPKVNQLFGVFLLQITEALASRRGIFFMGQMSFLIHGSQAYMNVWVFLIHVLDGVDQPSRNVLIHELHRRLLPVLECLG